VRVGIAELYVHGDRSSQRSDTEPTPMQVVRQVDVVEGMGIRQDVRFFRPPDPGRERPRQVSLIDEGTIWRHEALFGPIERSFIKSQIILAGDVFLPSLVDAVLVFEGGARMALSFAREPCYAMDLIKPGLRKAMENGQQGVLARVTASGTIHVGHAVDVVPSPDLQPVTLR
jgi:hypothetical protein